MTGNNPKLDLVNINAHTKFGLILSISSQDIERKQNSTSRAVTYVRKMMCYNPNLDLVNINAYKSLVKFYPCVLKILSGNQIMTDRMTDRRNEGQHKSSIAPLFQSGAIIINVKFIIIL